MSPVATRLRTTWAALSRRDNPWGLFVAALSVVAIGEILSPYRPFSAVLTLAGLVAAAVWWRPLKVQWLAYGWVVLFASFGDRIHVLAVGSLGADARASMLSVLLLLGALIPFAGGAYQPSFRTWLRRALFNDPWTLLFVALIALLPLLAPIQGFPVQILYGALLGLAGLTTLSAAAWIASHESAKRRHLLSVAVMVPVAVNAVNSINQFLFYRGVALPGSTWLIAADRALWTANWRHMLVERSTGMYLNSNTLAILAVTGVVLGLFGPVTRAVRPWLVGLSGVLVLLSQSRTAVVALVVVGTWAFVRREGRFDRRRAGVVAAVAVLALGALVAIAALAPSVLSSLVGERWARLLGGGLASDPSFTGRVMFWASSLSVLVRHPLGTWGPPQRFSGLPTDSEYLFDLLSGGIVMLGLWLAVLVSAWRRAGLDAAMRPATRALVIALAVLAATQDLHSAAPFVTITLLVLASTVRRADWRSVPVRPRVLMLSHLFPRTADDHAGVFVREQAAALCRVADVTVIVPRYDDAPADDSSTEFAVEVIRVPGHPGRFGTVGLLVALPFYVRHAVARARQHGPFDVVHGVYGYPDGVAAVLVGRTLELPVAVSLLGDDYFRQIARPLVGDAIGWAVASANRILCVNDTMTAGMRRRFSRDAERVVTLPTGYSAAHVVREPVPEREYFLIVANLIARKAPDVAVRAFASAAPRVPERLVIVGDGPMRSDLEALAAELGVADRVEFAGAVPHAELRRFYRGARALVLPSRSEGMPVVVNEALASGVPVVASRLPGTQQQVRSEHVGILVEPDDALALAEALVAASTTEWRYDQIAALSGVMSWDECATRLAEVYAEIADEPAPGWYATAERGPGG